MRRTEDLLRRLALHDEKAVHGVLQGMAAAGGPPGDLDAKTLALVRLGALLSLGATTDSFCPAVERARAAGATDEELVEVLVAVGPAVGSARLVDAAPRLALAIGYDLDDM